MSTCFPMYAYAVCFNIITYIKVCIHLHVYVYIHIDICIYACVLQHLSIYPYPSIHLSSCLPVYLSTCIYLRLPLWGYGLPSDCGGALARRLLLLDDPQRRVPAAGLRSDGGEVNSAQDLDVDLLTNPDPKGPKYPNMGYIWFLF